MIKNIIFDLGGVLLNLDYGLTDGVLKKLLGLKSINSNYPKNVIHLFNTFEKGSLAEASFFYQLQYYAEGPVEVAALQSAWNKMLLDLPSDRLDMLTELKKSFQVVLLSNTNPTHLRYFYSYLREQHDIVDFDRRFFDKTFYSHRVGMRKPEKSIYNHVLRSCRFVSDQTLFVDDKEENVLSAREVGIHAVHHIRNSDITTSITQYLNDH